MAKMSLTPCYQKKIDGLNVYKTKFYLFSWARSHGLVIMADNSQLSGCGFESLHHTLDGCKQCQLLQLKNSKNKGSQMGNTKKKCYLFSLRGQDVDLDQHLLFGDLGRLAGIAQVKLLTDLE
jgi:hypothetical protein